MRKEILVFLVMELGFVACSAGPSTVGEPVGRIPQSQRQETREPLTASGEQELRTIVQSGRLSGLQWPNFSNHGASVKEFYEENDFKLGWSRSGKPTAQALDFIRILEQADTKGLDSKDYDAARWADRVKTLQSGDGAAESGRVKFDVALTVSGIRYISDLHLGKVDPESLHKDFDPERQHHDAGAFLQEYVLGAQSVKDALVQVECPYPGYQRVLVALQRYLQMEREEVPDPLLQVKKPIEPAQTYSGLEKLVRRLQFLGDLPANVTVPADSLTYSREIAEGVKRFQVRHGLEAEGKLGPQTLWN